MELQRPWLKGYVPGVPAEVDFEKTTLSAALRRSAQRFPERPALVYLGRTITYRELDAMVDSMARALADIGVRPGDRVAALLPNIPQMTVTIYAVFRMGATIVPTNPLYTEPELQFQLADSGARAAVSLDLLAPRIEKVRPDTKLESVVYCHINDYLPFPKKQLFPLAKKEMYRKVVPSGNTFEFLQLIGRFPSGEVEDRSSWNGLAALLYTGGTTGVSKGAMLSHSNLSSNVQQFSVWFPAMKAGEGSTIAVFPFFHSAGFTAIQNTCIWMGWAAILVPRPEPGIITELVKKYRPDFVPGVPTIFTGLLSNPEFRKLDFSFVKGFFAGAAPLATDTIDDLKKLTGATIINVYGLTETSPLATANPFGGAFKAGTVGLPFPSTDARVVDLEAGTADMPPGQPGELIFRGPQVMQGYYNRPEETAGVLRDGWLYTGDIAVMDGDGEIAIVDRKKDLIIAGGFNIYPNEIDDVLFLHPKVLEACTIGVQDQYRGETVKAYVVARPGEALSEEEVLEHCRRHLTGYKVPRMVRFIDAIPKSAVGKILRREMKELDKKLEEERQRKGG
ncbi:MAG: long-chain fatty acid--CoA ligase [Spirochaetes bacterium]|nr:long-chain fatty acid--CoA ligase [Spirochaetota bacterium]